MAAQLCTNCHAPLELGQAAPGVVVRCTYCRTDNRVLGSGLAHGSTPGSVGFGAPPGQGFGPPPGFGAPPPAPGFGAPPPGQGFGTPGVIGGMTGLPSSFDANPKGYVAPPPTAVMPSTAGTNSELFGGIAGLLAWKGLVAVLGLVVPGLCCLSWIALQVLVGALGH